MTEIIAKCNAIPVNKKAYSKPLAQAKENGYEY